MKKHIFLTGFMGAGKSKIGRLLCKKFDYPFLDTDDEIEKQAGKCVKDIFEQDGESTFRKMEKETIRLVSESPLSLIIALGGGALTDAENFQIIQRSGTLVYIKSSPEEIYQRVKNSSKRPLLKQAERAKMLQRIDALLKERSPVYERADIVFDRDGLSLEAIVENLYLEIHQFWLRRFNGS